MSSLSKHHKELTNGAGKCSVPMWCGGLPAGFCDNKAYGERPKGKMYRDCTGEMQRFDGRYSGYVSALACPIHGGPEKKQALNLCTYCINDFGGCESNPIFGTGLGNDNVYECDIFKPKQYGKETTKDLSGE